MTRLESPDNIEIWQLMAARSSYRLARFRGMNAPPCIISSEARILYRRQRIVANLMVRNVARSN